MDQELDVERAKEEKLSRNGFTVKYTVNTNKDELRQNHIKIQQTVSNSHRLIRIAHSSVHNVLSPHWYSDFSPFSYLLITYT